MKVIVTGASGFLGKIVLKKLIESGIDCVGVSRRQMFGCAQVSDYAESPDGDILIHLAEINDRAHANKLSIQYENEASRTLNKLLNKGYSKVIYASSALLYENRFCLPLKETDPINATDTYTRVKLINESSVLLKLGVVARFSNIYGPGMSTNNVLSHIFFQLKNNDGPIRLKNLNSIRDFIWVEDAANNILEMIDPAVQGIFNIGSGVGTSIHELTQNVLKLSGLSERGVISEEIDSRASYIVLDVSKALNQFKFYSSLSLNEGLIRLINSDKGME